MSKILSSIVSMSFITTSLKSLSVESSYEKYVLVMASIIFAAIIVAIFGEGLCKHKDKNDEK